MLNKSSQLINNPGHSPHPLHPSPMVSATPPLPHLISLNCYCQPLTHTLIRCQLQCILILCILNSILKRETMRIRQILESKVLNFISIKNQYHHKVLKSEKLEFPFMDWFVYKETNHAGRNHRHQSSSCEKNTIVMIIGRKW